MKIRLLLFAALIIIWGCSQPLDCRKFKEGTFIIHDGEHTNIIRRSAGMQSETLDTDKTVTFAVKWINDHTYTLTPQQDVFIKQPKLPRNALMTVTITRTDSNFYTETTTTNFSGMSQTNDVFKVD